MPPKRELQPGEIKGNTVYAPDGVDWGTDDTLVVEGADGLEYYYVGGIETGYNVALRNGATVVVFGSSDPNNTHFIGNHIQAISGAARRAKQG